MATELLIRSFKPDLEVRSGGDGRTVYGRAVPYGVDQEIYPGLIERFEMGAFRKQISSAARVVFSRDHLPLGGVLIGKATMLEEKPDGLYGEWRVSATPAGDETLTLIRDEVLDELSIGFIEGQNKRDGEVTVRKTATLFEVAVVLEGAYGRNATAKGTRSVQVPSMGIFADAREAATRSRLEQARLLTAGLPLLQP